MKIKMIYAVAAMFLFAIAFSNFAIAKEESKNLKEVKIKTNAWNLESQNQIVDKLLEQEGVSDAYFSALSKEVTVKYNPDVTTVDEIRFTIEDLGYNTELAGEGSDKESSLTVR